MATNEYGRRIAVLALVLALSALGVAVCAFVSAPKPATDRQDAINVLRKEIADLKTDLGKSRRDFGAFAAELAARQQVPVVAGAPFVPPTPSVTGMPDMADPVAQVRQVDNRLAAYWLCDEDEGDVLHDLSGNGNDGTIAGATWAEGVMGKALSFDGRSSVKVSRSASLDLDSAITMIAWVKPATLGDLQLTILSRGISSTDGYDMGIHYSNRLFGRVGSGSGADRTLAVVNRVEVGKWQQVVVTYDEKESKLFLNGSLVHVKERTGTSGQLPEDLFIGQPADRNDLYFKGIIDEVRIYRCALSDREVLANYEEVRSKSKVDLPKPLPPVMEATTRTLNDSVPRNTLPVSTEGLVAYYPFEGNARDASDNGNDATMHRIEWTVDRFGQKERAARFNGVDSVIVKASPRLSADSFNEKTVCGWFRSDDSKQYAAMLFGIGAPGYGKNFQVGVGSRSVTGLPVVWRVNGYGDDQDYRTAVPVDKFFDGKWHHCAVTYCRGSTKVFFDGELLSETDQYAYETDPTKIVIGAEITGAGWNFHGDLDDVAVFSRALGETEIKRLSQE
jgi:hypothetical protein